MVEHKQIVIHYMLLSGLGKQVSKSFILNKQVLCKVESTLFLGVKLDSKLTWALHIQHIKMKIANNIGILCKAKKVFKVSTLTILKYSFIYPYMTYCIEVWGTAINIYVQSILKLQKLRCRIITNSP